MKNSFRILGMTMFAALLLNSCASDDENPVITLTGGTNIIIYKGDTYVDPGYTATDNKDGDITAEVSVSGTVGTDVDYYTITYTVTDKAGNFASEERNVTVKYKNTYLAGTYSVVETSPFGSETYGASVTADTSGTTQFVFGSLSANDPIVATGALQNSTGTALDRIELISTTQGGPLQQFIGSVSESTGTVVLSFSYLRPIGGTTTNCTATWTKQ